MPDLDWGTVILEFAALVAIILTICGISMRATRAPRPRSQDH